MMEQQISVLVVDDHTLVAQSIVHVLAMEEDIVVVGVAATAAAALDEVRRHRPDVVLLDYVLPDGGGAELVLAMKALVPGLEVVMMTGQADNESVFAAVEAGCLGFVTKDRAVGELVGAVRAARKGEPSLSPLVLRRLLDARHGATSVTSLSAREATVLQLLAGGHSTDAIADELSLSTKTVRNHVQRVLAKLDAHTQLEAVVKGVQAGIVRIAVAP